MGSYFALGRRALGIACWVLMLWMSFLHEPLQAQSRQESRALWRQGRQALDSNAYNKALGALSRAGSAYWNTGHLDSARAAFEDALRAAQAMKQRRAQRQLLSRLGILSYEQEDYAASQQYLEQHTRMCRQEAAAMELAAALKNEALTLQALGRHAEVLTHMQEAVTYYREANELRALRNGYAMLVESARAAGRTSRADSFEAQYQTIDRLLQQRRLDASQSEADQMAREAQKARQNEAQKSQMLQETQSVLDSVRLRDSLQQSRLEMLAQQRRNDSLQLVIKQQDLNQEQSRVRHLLVISFLILCLALLAYVAWRRQKQQNRELERIHHKVLEQQRELEAKNNQIEGINQELEEKVRRRTQRLRESYYDLQQFIYNSSHALRGPLSSMMGLLQLLSTSEQSGSISNDTFIDHMKRINERVDRMLSKLATIRFIQPQNEQGESESAAARCHLLEAMTERGEALRNHYQAEHIRFSIGGDPFIWTGPGCRPLEVIVSSLLENAIFFQRDAEAYPQAEVQVSQRVLDEELEIIVRDTGPGIAVDEQERIFEMFYRGDGASEGEGLGLYLCRKAVDMLEGHMTVDSQVGQGACFTVRLPLPTSSRVMNIEPVLQQPSAS